MAGIVPDAAVTFLLENLTELLRYNVDLVISIKDNIQDLQESLRTVKGLMNDLMRYDTKSEVVMVKVQAIRGVIWEAEDAIDSYLLQAANQRTKNWVVKTFHNVTDYPLVIKKLGERIAKIGDQVAEIKSQMPIVYQALRAEESHARQRQSPEEPKVEEDHVIGFAEPAREVVDLLTKGKDELEVVSIVGMLGLGKTTLAKMVYKDNRVDYEFMTRVFVYLSRDYDIKEVLLKILKSVNKSVNNDEVNSMGVGELKNYLKQQLEGKTYLVVLDDVWETKDWDNLKGAFPQNKRRCRVLITTRNLEVAKHANRKTDYAYKLDFLELEESQELLRWRVFREDVCPEDLQVYEGIIAAKCRGLPLALVVIAGILMNDPYRSDWWREVANSVEKNYNAEIQDAVEANKLIELMYHHLPNHLKPCFIYLGVFREDFEIPVWKLVRLWISEGFVTQNEGITIEMKAEQYLEQLVSRNLVMVGSWRSNGKIKTCRMHDTLCEFAKKQAAIENLFGEVKNDNQANPNILSGSRRLCINNVDIPHYFSTERSGKVVRSFLTTPKEETDVEMKLVTSISKSFKLLRLLEIESLNSTKFSPEISNLVLLQYVAISFKEGFIPSGFSKMLNLQTLVVKTNSPTLEIRVDIWSLPRFRHLHTNSSAIFCPATNKTKNKDSSLANTNVQTVCTISPESCKEQVFERSPYLKKLGIRGTLSRDSDIFENLFKLESVENLKLFNDTAQANSKLQCLHPKTSFPPRLTRLTLYKTRLNWTEMSKLKEIRNLQILKLKEHACQGDAWEPEMGGFKSLKHLYIGRTDLIYWTASAEHFPALESLELNNCDKLQIFPKGLGDSTTLQSVVLHCTSDLVASSARRLQVFVLEEAKSGKRNSSFKLSVYPQSL